MGIQNKDGALYFATGVDNTGLYTGRREAIGIIKAMAGEITSFDVFGGIGISAGIAFAQAAKGAYDFEKQFQQSMKEVATLSSGIKGSLTDYMNQVVDITRKVPVLANDAAKALYQIVSAGHDGADGMKILEVSAKAAIGGVTDTATAADAITTLINAYKLSASDAERISDQLFTTVKLGKTSFGELGQSIAQAAPVAAAYGVEIDQVLAAVATLTKQGTPTAQAMTQIRAAIVGVSKYLGDGAYNSRTFQEALELVRQEAGGSEAKLREMIPELEAVNGLLGLTGKNAQEAAGHLAEVGSSTGTATEAFKEMASSAENQMKQLGNNITVALRPLGEAVLKEVSSIASAFNKSFENGDVQESMKTLGDLIVTVTSAFVGYKGSILAASAAKQIHASITAILNKQRTIEIGKLVLSQGFYDADTAAVVKNTSARVLLTNALKAQFVATMKATGAMLTNPYVLAAAAVAGLGYAVYKLATAENQAEKATRKHREEQEKIKKTIEERKKQIEELIRIIQDETETEYAKAKAYDELQKLSPALTNAYTREQLAVASLTDTNKKLNEERDKNNYDNIISNVNKYTETLSKARAEEKRLREDAENEKDPEKAANLNNLAFGQGLAASQAERELAQWRKDLDEYNRLKRKANEDTKPIKVKLLEALSSRDQIVQEYAAAKLTLEEEQRKIQESGFGVIPIDVQIRFNNAQKQLLNINSIINNLQGGKKVQESSSIQNKSYWETQKKNAQTKLDALTDIEAAGKKGAELKQKIAGYDKKIGSFSTNTSKQDNQAEKLREQQEKYNLLLDKQALDQSRSEQDLQNQVAQVKIDSMQEGSAKTIAQMQLNHKKEMQQFEREKEDKLRKAIEDARAIFDAEEDAKKAKNPKHVKETFDASGIKLSDSETKLYGEQKDSLDEKQKKEIEDHYKSLRDSYQDYTDQRIAIEEKYNDDIATLQESRKKYEKEGNTEKVQQTNRAIAQATKNKGKELMGMDYDKLKESPEYVRAFENLKRTSSETLNSLLSQLENAKQTAAQVLSPNELREYTTTIQEIMDELDSRNPFQTLIDRKTELAEAESALAIASAQLDAVQKRGAKIETGSKNTRLNEKTGKIESEKTYLSATEALKKYNKAKDESVKASSNVEDAEREVDDVMGELFDSIKNVGSAIGGEAGEIIGIIGDVGQFALMAMDGVETASVTATTAVQAVEKASVILAIIGAAIQIATKIASLFNGTDYMEEFRKEMAKLNYELELAKLNAEISTDEKSIFGDDLWGNATKNVELANDALSRYNNTLNQIANRKKFTGFIGAMVEAKGLKNTYDSLGDSIANMELKIRHKTWFRSAKYSSLKDAVPELFNEDGSINQTALEQFIGSDTFVKLSQENQQYLQEMSDYWKAYQDSVEQVKDYLSDIFGDLGGTLTDTLVDAFANGTDAAQAFTDSVSEMLEQLGKQMIFSAVFSDIFNKTQEKMLDVTRNADLSDDQKFQEYIKLLSGMTDEVMGEQDKFNALLESYQKMAADKGIEIFKPSDSSKEALDSFVSQMESSFTSLDVTAKDVSDNIYDYFRQAMIKALYEKEYKSKMEELYKNFETLSADGLSDSDMSQLNSQIDQYINEMLKGVEGVNGLFADKLKDAEDIQSFVDNVKSAMSSIESTAEDVTDNIFEYIRQQMIDKMFADTFQPQIEAFYKKVQEAISDGSVTDEERDALRNEADKLSKDIIAAKDILSDTLGTTEQNLKKGNYSAPT